MKPITEEQLTNTEEALTFIDARADFLRSLCEAVRDVGEYTSSGKPQEALRHISNLLWILDDELDCLQAEINAAFDMVRKERKATQEGAA